MGRPLMSYIYPLGTEGWDGQVGQHHGSLRIEGWDGHRVMLKDGTSLNVSLITLGLINGMNG